MSAQAFVNLIADEPRETPYEVAARLLAGDGAAGLAVRTPEGMTPVGAVLHERFDRSEGARGCDVLLTTRDLGPVGGVESSDGADVMLAVDEFAPVCGVKAHTAGVAARGRLRALDDGDGAAPLWPGARRYRFTPATVQVRTTHGMTAIDAAELADVVIDEVAAARVDVVEDVLTVCGARLCQVGAAALARAGVHLEPRAVCPLAVDSWGATLLCVTDAGNRQVRATFDRPVSTPHEVVLAIAAYGRVAA